MGTLSISLVYTLMNVHKTLIRMKDESVQV